MNNLTFPKAIVFDMDGVIIDSEPLWKKAMIAEFSKYGIRLSESDCRSTTGKRIEEVAAFWFQRFEKDPANLPELINSIEIHLIALINQYGQMLEGLLELIKYMKQHEIKRALATSSSERIMHAVIRKLGLESFFEALCSAEHCTWAKPHPQVYLNAVQHLQEDSHDCWAIEDSFNGLVSARSAWLQTVYIPEQPYRASSADFIAHQVCPGFKAVTALLRSLKA